MRGPPARDKEQSPWQVKIEIESARRGRSSAPGVIGLACALARGRSAGSTSLVLERERPGRRRLGRRRGDAGAGRRGDLGRGPPARAGARVAPAVAASSRPSSRPRAGRETGYLELGALHVALDRDEAGELRRRFELMRALGLEAEWLPPSACRELEPGLGPGGRGGVHAPHEAAVDPRALIGGARRRASRPRAAGSRSPRSPAAILDGDRLVGVRTADGREHRAAAVVLAAGSWSAAEWLPPEARPPIRPVKGQILTLRGPPAAPGLRADRRHRARLRRPARRRAAGRRRDGRGAGLRHPGDGGRRPRAAARGLPGAARDRRARAGRGDRRPAPGDARQPAADRARARSTAWSSRPGTSATASCSRR